MHLGLIEAFKSTIRYGPLFERQEAFELLGQRRTKTLVIAGRLDPMIVADELKEDIETCMGTNKVEWRLIEGGHDTPCTHPEEIVDMIHDFWGDGNA